LNLLQDIPAGFEGFIWKRRPWAFGHSIHFFDQSLIVTEEFNIRNRAFGLLMHKEQDD
jgi:hypothetical protein